MTEKNIFKVFLSLNISDFSLFFMYKLQPPPPEKGHPHFPSNPLLKIEVLSAHPPPRFENLVGGSTPPAAEREGGCTLCRCLTRFLIRLCVNGKMNDTSLECAIGNGIISDIVYI